MARFLAHHMPDAASEGHYPSLQLRCAQVQGCFIDVHDGVLKEICHHDHLGECVLQKQSTESLVLDLPKVKCIKMTSNQFGLGMRDAVYTLMIV